MITENQVCVLRDMLHEANTDWLMSHLSIEKMGNRHFVIVVEGASEQDVEELFWDAQAALELTDEDLSKPHTCGLSGKYYGVCPLCKD
jgi:hypothetical protein